MESDAEKFKRLATKRVNKAVKNIRLIGNLSARSNYKFTDKQVKSMFAALRTEIADAEERFMRKGKYHFELEP